MNTVTAPPATPVGSRGMSLHEPTVRALHRIALDRQVKGRVPGLYAGVVRGGGFVWQEGIGAADVSIPTIAPIRTLPLDDVPVTHLDDTVGACRRFRVMRHHDNRLF